MARDRAGIAVLAGRIHVFGGRTADGGAYSIADHDAYDPASDRWTTLAPLPSARHAFPAATIGDVAYFAAGAPICGDAYAADLLAFRWR